MRATDLAISAPVVTRHTSALDAAALIVDGHRAGLVIADDDGRPVAVVSSVDVLALLVPRYVREDMSLAGVFDEAGADDIWSEAGDRFVSDLIDDDEVRIHDIVEIDADATLVEVAAVLTNARAQVAILNDPDATKPRFVTLTAVMEAVLRHARDSAAGEAEAGTEA